ncbi:coenzyme A transferase [Caulobacter segnis ATCC 21756]|uniref:Coenzyme A transferase n=1 Tax=Caulobacter segnis (strain ATCC 21756 / DSM 7131 / JCM 7823 / NBRC 15250 / LMG 17158 / TK0059) TaxID=509190 RepID=D5VGB6_CAUST|nr:CoA-transferase [Caulobacter segnis]ADG10235.1 coenzyme A transferase [Caulobacter segnis ATCC 21756]
MKSKIYESAAAALEGVVFDGMTLMSGGFGLSGNPETLIPAVKDTGVKGLTAVEVAPGVLLDEIRAKTEAKFSGGALA